MFSYKHLIIHASISASIAFLSSLFSLPSLLLYSLHTYIHPDTLSTSSSDGLRAAIRRPSDSSDPSDLKRRGRSKSSSKSPEFDEANAQLFRLRLVDSHLRTRLYYPQYRTVFISSSVALCSYVAHRFFPGGDTPIPVLSSFFALCYLFISLTKLSLEWSASKRSERQLASLLGFLGFLAALVIEFALSPSVLDFRFSVGGNVDAGLTKVAAAAIAGCLAGLLFMPATRAARSLWIGTDQLRWNLGVVSCGSIGRGLLYIAFTCNVFTALLWINPVGEVPARAVGSGDFSGFRIWCLFVSAILQLVVLRSNLQMYLNEAVLSWYQRLHASKVPDMDFGRAKIFLHNHYLCLVVLQFFAPPALVLLFLSLSQVKGNLFSGFLVVDSLGDCSDLVKETSLFLAWWTVYVWAVFTTFTLALFRCGVLFIS